MDRYRQRTIAELLKKTSKLIKPRMTPILEGKDRMQGPLDITDPNIDFALLQVCGNCRNHLDASIAQNCGICNKGHHSFCLEAPLNEAGDGSPQCCYDCRQKAALDSNQPGSSLKDSHSELLEDRMDVCQSSENVPGCEELGTSYDASDRSPVSKKMHLSWNEASPSMQTADSVGTMFDTLYKPTKTRAARKLGIRRKRVADGFGSDSLVLPSETDTPMPLQESSGVDAALEVEGILPTCLEGGSEESKDLDHTGSTTADIQTKTLRMRSESEEANGNQLLEVHVGSPSKYAEHTVEETATVDELAKKGNVMETKKSAGSPKLDVAVPAQPVSCNSCVPPDASTTLEAPSMGIQEELRVVGPQTSRDLAKEQHFSNKSYATPQMIVEEDDGERQILIVRQVSSVEELPKQGNDANRLPAMPSHVEPFPNANPGIRSPTAHRSPAFDGLRSKPSSSSVLDGQTEDEMRKPSFFGDMKRALPSIQEGLVEHLSNGLNNKAGPREWLPHKEHSSPKAHHMDLDCNFAGSEIPAAFLGSPNTRAVMEDEMKVCDLCGDSGYEDMLAICNECNGAEHVYCYENLMAQLPEGDWQCDVCKSKQKAGDFRSSTDIRTVNLLPSRSPSFNSLKKHSNVGSSRSRLSALLQKRRLPSEKKRAMKGIPSSQFPAKRGLPVVDAPPAKKQAVEASSPPYTASATSLKLGLIKEASFKMPDTGKVKFVSHTALMGPTGEGLSLSSRGSGKFSLSTGSPSSVPHNSSMAQSGQMSKGRFSNASNSILGPGNARVNTTSQSNTPSSSSPVVSSGLKTPAALKSSESIPSFLLPLKPMGSKLQPSFRSFKETSDNLGLQSIPKEGLSGQSSTSSTRTLSKTGSFKLSKGPSVGGALDPKLRQDANLDSAKSSGLRNVPSQVGLVKAVESKYEAVLKSGLPEIKSKGLAPIELSQSGIDQVIKKEPAGSLQVTKDETVLAASGTCETQQSSFLGSPVKDVQDLSTEQDKKSPFQVTSPHSLARQTPKLPEEVGVETLKEESMTSMDVAESAPLLPCPVGPVLVIQESSTFREDENKPLQLAVTVDVDGDKNVLAVEKTPTHDDNRNSFTPRSRPFGAWFSPSYVPSLGSTRCYRCKELGHSAKNCNNRSPTVCVSSEAAGALKGALPASNADSTCVLKGATPASMDDVTKIVQSNVEPTPKIKPTTEVAPIVKASSTERGVVFTQNLNLLASEGPPQVEEDQVVEAVTPSTSPLMDQVMRKDATVLKQIAESPIKVSDGGGHHTDNTRETADGKEEVDNTSMRFVSSTVVNVSGGTQSITSSAEWQPPLLSLPSLTRSAAHMSSALTPVSSSNVKATSPFVSRYQESLKVYPEAQIVWQGTFEVAGKAKPQVSFHGLQANPSNRALSKVREVAKKLQPLLPLEELPRGSEHNSWPAQFQKSPPINDNIALYFFANGKESYVQYYKPLVDHLIKFDLTLKGFIEDAELLIFPSNLLPPGSQCWNNFMFLWAVFRARKLPIKQSNMCSTSDSKQPGSDSGSKQSLQSGVLTWGKVEGMQIDTIATKTIDMPQAAGSRSETPSSAVVEGANTGRQCSLSDFDVVVCDPPPPCLQEPQHLMQGEAAAKEEQKAQSEPVISQPEKAVATVLLSTQDSIAVKSQALSDVLLATEGGLNLNASNESPQKFNSSSIKLEEKDDTSMKLVVPSAPKVSSVLVRSEHGSIEKAKHSTPLMGTLPALLVCPSPRDRQEDVWTPRKLSSHSPAGHLDKDKGVRDRLHEKSDKMESGRGVSRDRDRERQREREKHKERDRDRDRSRRHSDWERERERERGKERERDRDRDRDRDRGRERERERDRERWRDREGRDRRGRDWDRDREKVGDREKARDRGREREAERERALTRDRSSRHRHWDPAEADHVRSGRHCYRYPRSRSPSRSPPGNRDSSPARPWLDRYHRYHRSFRQSRSYSHSPDSDHGLARLQPRAESRDLSKDSFAPKGKSPDTVVGDSRAKEESVVKNSVVKDSGGDEQGNYSQRGSNSNSLCRENSAGKERKLPIADLNLSPSEIEGNEEEGNDDDVMMSVEVAKPLNAHQDDHTSGCHDFLPADGLVEEPGECSNSAGKTINNQSTEHLMCVDGSRSLSLINDSSGPSYFPRMVSLEGSSSCLQFFSQPADDDNRALSTPDLSLALGATEQSPPQQAELPLFRQLLEPCQGSLRGGSFNPSLNVPTIAEQADLSLSLAIPEHSKRPVVNTSLRLFG